MLLPLVPDARNVFVVEVSRPGVWRRVGRRRVGVEVRIEKGRVLGMGD